MIYLLMPVILQINNNLCVVYLHYIFLTFVPLHIQFLFQSVFYMDNLIFSSAYQKQQYPSLTQFPYHKSHFEKPSYLYYNLNWNKMYHLSIAFYNIFLYSVIIYISLGIVWSYLRLLLFSFFALLY